MGLDHIAGLLEGYRRFRAGFFQKNKELFRDLATEGQAPRVMVIACSDSRVDPALIMSASPGDLFMVRNVANLVPPYQPDGSYHGTSAALEFAVRFLAVEEIIVLGHSKCGGVNALMQDTPVAEGGPEFIDPWMAIARKARDIAASDLAAASEDERLRALEQAAIVVSLENLHTFPWIDSAAKKGCLRLHGWHFDIEPGTLYRFEPRSGRFEPLGG
jgi:carbonic anhydrase